MGNVDTYLLWKLTDHKVFATDYSNASSTGLYDTYQVSIYYPHAYAGYVK